MENENTFLETHRPALVAMLAASREEFPISVPEEIDSALVERITALIGSWAPGDSYEPIKAAMLAANPETAMCLFAKLQSNVPLMFKLHRQVALRMVEAGEIAHDRKPETRDEKICVSFLSRVEKELAYHSKNVALLEVFHLLVKENPKEIG